MKLSATCLTLVLASFISTRAAAQLTLGAEWLIEPGDAVTYYADDAYRDAAGNIARKGANQRWVFEGLGQTGTTFVVASEPRTGRAFASFPNASVLLTSTSPFGLAGADSEIYLRRQSGKVEIIGIAPEDSTGLLTGIRFNDPLLYQSTPLTYNSSGTDMARARFTFPPEVLGLILGDTTGTSLIDSAGLSIGQDIAYEVDGWGEIIGVGAPRACLRMRTVTEAFQEFEVKVPFFGWVPISRFIQLPDSIISGALPRTVDYSWIVAESPFPIVRLEVDSTGRPVDLQYAASFSVSAQETPPTASLGIRQEGSRVLVDLPAGLEPGGWIDVLGVDGRRFERRSLARGQSQVELDGSSWGSGVYLVTYWLNGQLRATGKLVRG